MADEQNPREFPDVTHKLTAPKKLSAFEKERQAAEAKRQRAEAENAAALKAFEDSFADEDDDDPLSHISGGRGSSTGPRGSGMGYGGPPGRFGMPPAGPRSGPGSLGPMPGPPPPSLKRKRALDEMREQHESRREQSMLGQEDSTSDPRGSPQPVHVDEREDDAPKPTIQLSSLPPGMPAEEIKVLLRDHLKVHSVRFLPPSAPGSNTKRSMSAIVTLSSDVSTGQVDTAVTALKNKYLSYGFCLSISRHLSSTALHPSMGASSNIAFPEPFGAEKPRDQQSRFSMRNAPPPMDHRGFAPPDSYDSPGRQPYGSNAQPDSILSVHPPWGIEVIKAVHTVVDHLLLEPNPERALETEAMLMSLPEVQKDERFAFLYDSRSPAGVYYRYLLWAPEDRDEAVRDMKRHARGPERIHQDMAIDWLLPYSDVPFLDLKSLDQVVTDIDYVSSDEESDDEGGERQFNSGREDDVPQDEKKHLTPLQRARFAHLLSRLPTSNARLRKGDVARITNFAINHAGQGAEEIVDTLLLNIEKPFSYSLASKYEDSDQEQDEADEYEPDEDLSNLDSPAPQEQKDSKRDDDPSNAKLIALYLISDVLSASSTAGARNAWKYRQLFESGFRAQKTFEHLGKLEKELAWGRLKAEQWKRKVGVVFGIWEGWSVFSGEVHEELKQSFLEPPISKEEKEGAQAQAEREGKKRQGEKWKGKFKRVGQAGSPAGSASPAPRPTFAASEQAAEEVDGTLMTANVDGLPLTDDVDGVPMDDVDGVPMEDVDGTPMDNLDGVTMSDDVDGKRLSEPERTFDEKVANERPEGKVGFSMSGSQPSGANGKPKVPPGPRRRMRAEDMFADSDED